MLLGHVQQCLCWPSSRAGIFAQTPRLSGERATPSPPETTATARALRWSRRLMPALYGAIFSDLVLGSICGTSWRKCAKIVPTRHYFFSPSFSFVLPHVKPNGAWAAATIPVGPRNGAAAAHQTDGDGVPEMEGSWVPVNGFILCRFVVATGRCPQPTTHLPDMASSASTMLPEMEGSGFRLWIYSTELVFCCCTSGRLCGYRFGLLTRCSIQCPTKVFALIHKVRSYMEAGCSIKNFRDIENTTIDAYKFTILISCILYLDATNGCTCML